MKFKALAYTKIKSLKLELFTLLVIFHSKLLSSSEKKIQDIIAFFSPWLSQG